MPDNPTPRDATPTLAELEGTYWRSIGAFPDLRWRVRDGNAEVTNIKNPEREWSPSDVLLKHIANNRMDRSAGCIPMTPAEIAATWPELAPAAPVVAGEGRHSTATNAWYGYPSDTNTPPDTAPAIAAVPREHGRTAARGLSAKLLTVDEPPAKQKRGEAVERQEERHKQAEQTRRERAARGEEPAKQKRGKWRKRAEAADLEVERLKGERDEACANLEVARRYAALYHSQLRTLATPDPPPTAPATDPAGYREGQVVEHVKGGLYRCTRPVDTVDGEVMCYSLADGFQLWFPADMLRPIPPHPGCVVLASIATQLEYYVVNAMGTDGTILCDGDYRFAPGNFTVMAPAPGWQGEEATRHDA